MKPTPAWRACSTYHLVACSRTDRQVADHDVDLALLEDADDVGRGPGRLLDDLAQVLAQAVVGHPALDGDAGVGDLLEDERVVRLRVDRLGQVLADLVLVDVEGGHELDVADVVAAEVDVHQARDEVVDLGVLVVVAALDEAARAVADADDRDADLAVAAAGRAGVGRVGRDALRGVAVLAVACHVCSCRGSGVVRCGWVRWVRRSGDQRWADCRWTWTMRWTIVMAQVTVMMPRATARAMAPASVVRPRDVKVDRPGAAANGSDGPARRGSRSGPGQGPGRRAAPDAARSRPRRGGRPPRPGRGRT